MVEFANWLQGTAASNLIQRELWMVPTIQSVHIIAIAFLVGAVLMITLSVLGVVGRDQSMATTNQRFAPWFWGALAILAVTGLLLIIGEPKRELLSFSFWAKMTVLAIGVSVAIAFQRHLKSRPEHWEVVSASPATKALAVGTLIVWALVMILGRFIAFDAQIWGSLSPQA